MDCVHNNCSLVSSISFLSARIMALCDSSEYYEIHTLCQQIWTSYWNQSTQHELLIFILWNCHTKVVERTVNKYSPTPESEAEICLNVMHISISGLFLFRINSSTAIKDFWSMRLMLNNLIRLWIRSSTIIFWCVNVDKIAFNISIIFTCRTSK